MRRTPVYDPFDDHDDPSHDPGPNVRRISTNPGPERTPRRVEVRPLHASRRVPPRRGPDPRVWFVRGSLGIAALAGLWLGLQALFPVTESQVAQAPTPAQPVDASAVGAPEPPVVQPTAQQPAPTPVAQAAPAPEGDRLPGLPTPVPGAASQAAPAAAAPPAQAAVAPPAPAQPQAAAPPPAQPAAEPKPREENPSQQPVGTPTLEPIPPPPSAQASNPPPSAADQQAAQAAQEAQRAAAPPAPAPKPQAPPPAAASSGGPFGLTASASPVNPVSERAVVTISVLATQNGAPLAGASCMATIHYRTATAKQPNGGFRTNANGVGSFTLDARNTTYGFYIPVDVTCSGRGGTATARTGFTPVKGR